MASVLSQTVGDMELIVSDNCSTDRTREIVRDFADDRIALITTNELVPAHSNWTRAVEATSGEHVKLMCADDWLLDGCLANQVDSLVTHPTAVLAASRRRVLTYTGGVLRPAHGLSGLSGLIPGGTAIRATARSGTNILGEPVATMFRGDLLRHLMPWSDEHPYVIDLELYLRALTHGDLFAQREVLGAFEVSVGSWSGQLARQQSADFHSLIDAFDAANPNLITAPDRQRGKVLARAKGMGRKGLYRWMKSAERRRRGSNGDGRQ